jgi:hypothetical protein
MIDPLRDALTEQAKTGAPVAYGELARRLKLQPPHTIHRLTEALERLMEEDAAAGRPLLAALAASKTKRGLPGPGFFLKAQRLGIFAGEADGPDADGFYAEALQRAVAYYGGREEAS